MQHKEWLDLELQDQVHQDLELDPKAELIVLEQDQVPAERVQVLLELSQDLVAVHQEVHFLPGDQLVVAVAASVAELLEHLVRVEQEDRARLESLSALSEKNLNKEVSRA
jgi:dihydroxyacetone kinase-like predicted kinase